MKFRAWEKNKKVMITSKSLSFSYHNGKTFGFAVGDLNHCFPIPKENVELMEYTEFLDKNNVEICESDVVKKKVTVNKELHGDFALYEVLKINGVWVLSYLCSEKGQVLPKGYLRSFLLDEFEIDTELFLWSEEYKPRTELEVVGHIYEDPSEWIKRIKSS